MTLLRRSLAAIVVLPVWIVMILTGGQWCLMPGSATAHPVAGHEGGASASRAQAHHAMAHSQALAEQSTSEDHPSHSTRQEHGPRGCESQTACSVAIAPAPQFASLPAHQRAARASRLHVDRLASLVLAPELPPPRA